MAHAARTQPACARAAAQRATTMNSISGIAPTVQYRHSRAITKVNSAEMFAGAKQIASRHAQVACYSAAQTMGHVRTSFGIARPFGIRSGHSSMRMGYKLMLQASMVTESKARPTNFLAAPAHRHDQRHTQPCANALRQDACRSVRRKMCIGAYCCTFRFRATSVRKGHWKTTAAKQNCSATQTSLPGLGPSPVQNHQLPLRSAMLEEWKDILVLV